MCEICLKYKAISNTQVGSFKIWWFQNCLVTTFYISSAFVALRSACNYLLKNNFQYDMTVLLFLFSVFLFGVDWVIHFWHEITRETENQTKRSDKEGREKNWRFYNCCRELFVLILGENCRFVWDHGYLSDSFSARALILYETWWLLESITLVDFVS